MWSCIAIPVLAGPRAIRKDDRPAAPRPHGLHQMREDRRVRERARRAIAGRRLRTVRIYSDVSFVSDFRGLSRMPSVRNEWHDTSALHSAAGRDRLARIEWRASARKNPRATPAVIYEVSSISFL